MHASCEHMACSVIRLHLPSCNWGVAFVQACLHLCRWPTGVMLGGRRRWQQPAATLCRTLWLGVQQTQLCSQNL